MHISSRLFILFLFFHIPKVKRNEKRETQRQIRREGGCSTLVHQSSSDKIGNIVNSHSKREYIKHQKDTEITFMIMEYVELGLKVR